MGPEALSFIVFIVSMLTLMGIGLSMALALVLTGAAMAWTLDFWDTQLLAQKLWVCMLLASIWQSASAKLHDSGGHNCAVGQCQQTIAYVTHSGHGKRTPQGGRAAAGIKGRYQMNRVVRVVDQLAAKIAQGRAARVAEVVQPADDAHQGARRVGPRKRNVTSRIESCPSMSISTRARPMPKPPWGGTP